MIGTAAAHTGLQGLARDMADHLRALLRDVVCGHLDPNLVGLADQLLLETALEPEVPAHEPAEIALEPGEAVTVLSSVEQMLGDPGQSQEILDIFI